MLTTTNPKAGVQFPGKNMKTPCDYCPIRKNCDFISGLCNLADDEIARFRPDLIGLQDLAPDTEVKTKAYKHAEAQRKYREGTPEKHKAYLAYQREYRKQRKVAA